MNMVKLADYLFIKYAADQIKGNISFEPEDEAPITEPSGPDTSFGIPINAEKTRILKDKLIAVYDKINKDITKLPAFKQMNEDLKDDLHLIAFNDAINDLVITIEHATLKDGFSFAVKMIHLLNQLRRDLRFRQLDKNKKIQLDLAIKNVQDTIWEESKRILNIHDLRGLELEFPELKGLLGEIVPTWDYGPGKSIVQKPIGQRYRQESPKNIMKRLEQELEEEKKKK